MTRLIVFALAAVFAVSFGAPTAAFAKTSTQIKQETKAREYKARKAAERAAKEAKKAAKSSQKASGKRR